MRKTQKMLAALLAVITIGVGAIGLTACGGDGTGSDISGGTSVHTHDWNERVTKEPTCEKDGVLTYSCYCGESYTVSLDALGHHFKVVEAKMPTCTEFGWESYQLCERDGCGYTTYAQIDAKGHNFDKGYCIVEGCGVQQPPEDHITHEWDNGVVTTEPTCTEKGVKTYTCWCTEKYTEPVAELGHDKQQHEGQAATCVEVGWNAYETCSRCDYTTYEEIAINVDNHDYEDGICTDCGNKLHSKGLDYTLSEDGMSYSVTRIGECIDTELIIPSTYEGLPVTSIGDSAFSGCSSLTSVVIGDSVTSIGEKAFRYCSSLTEVVIPDRVTSIGGSAFYYCSSLTEVVIPDRVTSIGGYTFYFCSSLTEIVIGDSVKSIGDCTFTGCSSLTEVVIGESVKSIGVYAFEVCSSLTQIEIPDSVKSIGDYAFKGCSSLTEVVFIQEQLFTSSSET